jgi:uncharacterized protein
MLQTWADLTSVHWPYPPEVVQRVLPSGLEVDAFDGRAWVGLIPFQMRHIRPPGTPPIVPWIGTFPETNVRVYARDGDGRDGVYFLSLDITRSVAVAVARTWYRLPYNRARMTTASTGPYRLYAGRRRWPGPARGASSEMLVEVGDPIPPDQATSLDHHVSARWGLHTVLRGRLAYAPVDHPRWPLHEARLIHLRQDLVQAAGLPEPSGEPHVRYSPGVDVRIGLPRRAV